jgi:hypothetical protein
MNKPAGKKDLSRGSMLALLGLQAMVFALIGGLLWAWTGRPLHELVTPDFHQLGLGVALAAALVATALAGFRIFPDLAEKLCRLQASNFPFLRDGLPFPAIVWISICAGIGEEILFRGGLQTLAIDHVGPIAGITLSSMVFALVHLGNRLIGIFLFGISLIFGVVYWLTGSLSAVMVGHVLYDVFALAYLQHQLHRIGGFEECDAP